MTTKDRLNTLQQIVEKIREQNGDTSNWNEGVENTALQIEDENAGYMEYFFREVETTRGWIDEIKEHIGIIRALHSNLLSSPRPDQEMKQELDSRTTMVKNLGKKVTTSLKALEKGISQEEEELDSEKKRRPAGLRIRRTQHSCLLHLFMEAMSTFNTEQVEYREKCSDRMKRVISIAKAVVTDDKLEELLDQGNYGAIFNGDIITETLEARKALEDVQTRHEELIKIEKSIQELRDLFMEMYLLVQQQSDLINRIENHVLATVDHVEEANVVTKKAIQYQKKAKLKKIILLVILALVILGIILAFVTWPKKS